MVKGYLLDTNIVIDRRPFTLLAKSIKTNKVYTAVITECEVFTGLKPEKQLKVTSNSTIQRRFINLRIVDEGTHFLDNLKVVLTMLVVAHHVGLPYRALKAMLSLALLDY